MRLLSITERGNRYIITCIDYMMKWVEAKLLSDKLVVQVVWFIYEEIICRYRCLAIIQSDNRLEFINKIIRQLLDKFEIWHQ